MSPNQPDGGAVINAGETSPARCDLQKSLLDYRSPLNGFGYNQHKVKDSKVTFNFKILTLFTPYLVGRIEIEIDCFIYK